MLTSPQRENYCLRRARRADFRAKQPRPAKRAATGDYLASLTKQEEAGEKTHHSEDIREAHARGEQAMSVVLRARLLPRKPVKWQIYWVLPSLNG